MLYKYIVSFFVIGSSKYISTIVESDKDYLLIHEADIYRIIERMYGVQRSYLSNVNYREYTNEAV
jgi:hypothetical protein